MKNANRLTLLLLAIPAIVLNIDTSFAQKKLNWHANFGVGTTDMRNFNHTFNDIYYDTRNSSGDDYFYYRLNSKPDYLISAGMGLSGVFRPEGIAGWDVGLNIRTGGFRLRADLLESEGEISGQYQGFLPEFDKTNSFRYWGVHVPLSFNYIPFEVIGFTIGGDLYYQLSSTPTDAEFPHAPLGPAMGFLTRNPQYQHPVQFGAHFGVYAPIGEKLRLDLQFMTDLSPRLSVDHITSNWKFREIGLMLNIRYNLDW